MLTMLNTSPKLYLISLLVNGTQGMFFLSYNKDCICPQHPPMAKRRGLRRCDTLRDGYRNEQRRGSDDGRTAASAGASADQSGRERTTGRVQQPGNDSPQPRGVYAQLYLYFPERPARQAAEEHDRQPGSCQANFSRAGREHRALRGAIRHHQGNAGRRPDTKRGIRTVGKWWAWVDLNHRP